MFPAFFYNKPAIPFSLFLASIFSPSVFLNSSSMLVSYSPTDAVGFFPCDQILLPAFEE